MNDLWNELDFKRKELSQAVKDLRDLGSKAAGFEREYKKAYRSEVFTLHEVDKIAWTACNAMAHGDTKRFDVAERRYNRDLAQTLYEAKKEEILAIKLEMRMLSNQIEREWSQSS